MSLVVSEIEFELLKTPKHLSKEKFGVKASSLNNNSVFWEWVANGFVLSNAFVAKIANNELEAENLIELKELFEKQLENSDTLILRSSSSLEWVQGHSFAGLFTSFCEVAVFDDFIAAAEYLIDNKYTKPEKLAISGGSNGGLLVGAVAVQRPDLYRAVLCTVPLLDMLKYHKFKIGAVWAEEYGTADSPEQYEYLVKYSPYHNIKKGIKYPSMLIIGADNDARVDAMHARKYAAELQRVAKNPQQILLQVYTDAGHVGSAKLSQSIKHSAQQLGFLMHETF